MFIRSKDGTHITELHDAQIQGKDLLINGTVFETFDSEEEAALAIRQISQEMNALETFLDLSGEFQDDDDDFWDDDDDFDDDEYDSDDDDGPFNFSGGKIIFTDDNGKPFI